MSDQQIDDLDLDEIEEASSTEPKSTPDPAKAEIMKWKRRAQAAERDLRTRDIQSLKGEFPSLEDSDLEGQDLSKVRALLSKLKPVEPPVTDESEKAVTTPEIEDHKRFVATRGSTEQTPETYTARELQEMLQRGAITVVQMNEFIANGRMKT